MKLEQKTITTIVADEGKMLVRKSDGHIAGEQITLGYNYYDAGLPLKEPYLETPDDYEEIDKPVTLDESADVDKTEVAMMIEEKKAEMKRLKRVSLIMKSIQDELDNLHLSPKEALEIKDLYYHFGEGTFSVGSHVTKCMKCQHLGKLYSVIKEHTILPHFSIDNNTIGTLYAEVDENFVEEEDKGDEEGTTEDSNA